MNTENALNILLVDDEEMVRSTIADMLLVLGHHTLEAGDGVEALEILKNNCFDLIITDVGMPNMDGLTLIEQIRKAQIETPIIVVAGQHDLAVVQKTLAAGALTYMPKPIMFRDIASALQTAT